MKDRPKQGNRGNATHAGECAATINADDGRVKQENPEDHKGDWGRHAANESMDNDSED